MTGHFSDLRILVPALLTVIAAAVPAIGYFAYGYDMKVLGFPLGIGLFAVAMGVLSVRAEWRGLWLHETKSSIDSETGQLNAFDEAEGLLENRDTWIQVGWIVLFAVAAWALGFLLGPSLMLALYLLWDGRGLRAAVPAALLMAAVVWLMSTSLIRVPLPLLPLFWS